MKHLQQYLKRAQKEGIIVYIDTRSSRSYAIDFDEGHTSFEIGDTFLLIKKETVMGGDIDNPPEWVAQWQLIRLSEIVALVEP